MSERRRRWGDRTYEANAGSDPEAGRAPAPSVVLARGVEALQLHLDVATRLERELAWRERRAVRLAGSDGRELDDDPFVALDKGIDEELVRARLDRLSERGRGLAGLAATIGREFEFELLQRASGLGEDEAAAGKHWAGAPATPEKTWFQTPFDQPLSVLLRTTHCCWEPFTMLPSNLESAMKPPLAYDGPVQ